MAESVVNGNDAVILLRNTSVHLSTFIMTQPDVTDLRQIDGGKVGVLTDAYRGQTGVITRRTLEAQNIEAEFVGLGTYRNIYAALADRTLTRPRYRSSCASLARGNMAGMRSIHCPTCQSALNIAPLSACNVDPFGDARRRSYR